MFWTILFAIFFIFRPTALADDTPTPTPTPAITITWLNGDTNARQNNQFSLNVNLNNLSTSSTYYVGAKGGPNSGDCYILLKNLYNGCNGFNSGNLFPVTWNGQLTFYPTASGISGSYQIYAYIYDANGNLLNTTGSPYTITINDPIPTNTPTLTPTVTPTPTITPTPTVIPTDTPLPILTPILEATPTDSPEDQSGISLVPSVTPAITPASGSGSSSNFFSFLPLILIIFGGLILAVPLFGSKIIAWIKSKKTPPAGGPPTVQPPVVLPPPVILPPTPPSLNEII